MQSFFVITESDLQAAKEIYSNSEFIVLNLLKDRGAPVEGTLSPRIKDGYWVSHHREAFTGNYIYIFKKAEHE